MKTKFGEPIQMRYKRDLPNRGIDAGWAVHLVTAYVNNEEAGYLKIGYLPSEKLATHMPNVLHYAGLVKGWSGVTRALKSGDTRALIRAMAGHLPDMAVLMDTAALADKSQAWLDATLENYTQRVTEKYGGKFADFLSFHVDKPMVDFIKVYAEGQKKLNLEHPGDEKEVSLRDYRRQHIGLALYKAGAQWMAEQDMRLYASGLQGDEAQCAWSAMQGREGYCVMSEQVTPQAAGRKPYQRRFLSYLDADRELQAGSDSRLDHSGKRKNRGRNRACADGPLAAR